MSENRDLKAAWNYHDATKHSYESIRQNRHFLDWDNQPLPFKIYSGLEPIALPRKLSSSGRKALETIAAPAAGATPELPDLQRLAELLYLSAGITKRRPYPGGEMLFRAAACTGALYHIDLYLACGDLPDLAAGVYHFGPHDFSLRKLRAGDYRAVLIEATGGEPAVRHAPATLLCVSTFWRNAWKYQSRTYRHCFWDNGTLLANLLAAAVSREVPARVVVGFVDSVVSQLLGLDTTREAALTLIPLGHTPAAAPTPAPEMSSLELETTPLSRTEVDYPAIRAMHRASSLESPDEVIAWRADGASVGHSTPSTRPSGRVFPLQPVADDSTAASSLEEVISRRGSTRRFARVPITFVELSTLLERATRGVPADFANATGEVLNDLYLIVNAVDGLPSGAYFFDRERSAVELLKEGDFRQDAGHLGLGQEIPADASVDVFFLTDLKPVLEQFGNRGYRAAQLDAAIMGGKLYLGAYAQGLGASGLTFFDDDVTSFFSPHAVGKSVMFLVALGKSARQAAKA
ncbi:MAG: SagB/ThcOx family dehydrogenase [Candidatus Binatia bacterium]